VIAAILIQPASPVWGAREGQRDEESLLRELDALKPGASASDLAENLGRLSSAKGLQKLIERGEEEYIAAYAMGQGHARGSRVLSPEIEALMAKNLDSPSVGMSLLSLLDGPRVINGRRYQGQELFDRLYRKIRQPDLKPRDYESLASALVSTDLPIEAQVFELLGSSPQGPATWQGREHLLVFLGNRKYAPVVPVMREALEKEASYNGNALLPALLGFDTQESLAAVAAFAKRVAAGTDRIAAGQLLDQLFEMFQRLRPQSPFELAALRSLLPTPMNRVTHERYVSFIADRRDPAGVPDLLGFLADKDLRASAQRALLAFESPEVWEKAHAELQRLREAGVLNAGQYEQLAAPFLERRREPQGIVAQLRTQRNAAEASQKLHKELEALRLKKLTFQDLRGAKPEQWLAEELAYVQGLERLRATYQDVPEAAELSASIAKEQVAIANVLRFRQGKPTEAIARYAAAREAAGTRSLLEGAAPDLLAGDTFEFDLHDAPHAIEAYERALRLLGSREPGFDEVGLVAWQKAWLGAEIDYLKTGKVYGGTPIAAEAHWALFVLLGGGVLGGGSACRELRGWQPIEEIEDLPQADPVPFARELAELPPSHVVAGCTLPAASLLPSEADVRSYFQRNDPAGYWTASVLALVSELTRQAAAEDGGDELPTRHWLLPGLTYDRPSAIALVAAGRVKMAAAPENPADSSWVAYYPAAVGHEWVWEVTIPAQGGAPAETRTLTRRVARAEEDPQSRFTSYYDDLGKFLFFFTPAGLLSPDGVRFLIPAPHKGSTWDAEGAGGLSQRFRVLEAGGPVTVRGRTWEDCLVIESDMRPAAFGDERGQKIAYRRFGDVKVLCRGVGLVRSEAYEIIDAGRRVQATQELVTFHTGLPGPSR
jgi:hypothetical protein